MYKYFTIERAIYAHERLGIAVECDGDSLSLYGLLVCWDD